MMGITTSSSGEQEEVWPTYMETEHVAAMLLDNGGLVPASARIIDVRDEDEFSAGHIKGALHLPSEEWQESEYVSNVLKTHCCATNPAVPIDTLIVHCQYSQQRGPRCAHILQKALNEQSQKEVSAEKQKKPLIYIMRGGFGTFNKKYSAMPGLVEL